MSRSEAPGMPSKLASIPAFPSVALKLLTLVSDEFSSLSDIATCIAGDSVITGQLIKRANAADQAAYCEVREVLQAAVSLGIDRTREIALGVATSTYARAAIDSEILRPCWHHTLACAIVAGELARMWGLRPAECYTAGLFHEIGRLGLLTAYPKEYEAIMAGTESDYQAVTGRERERFEIDHVEAGIWLAKKWNLPESIVEVITRCHETPRSVLDQLTVGQVACRVAQVLGYGLSKTAVAPKLQDAIGPLPEWARKQLHGHLPVLQETVSREIQLFEGCETAPSKPPEAQTAAPEPKPVPESKEMPPQETPLATMVPQGARSRWAFVGTILLIIALMLSTAVLCNRR
jgi:putative nucleotidyltransferase with HDIG domain